MSPRLSDCYEASICLTNAEFIRDGIGRNTGRPHSPHLDHITLSKFSISIIRSLFSIATKYAIGMITILAVRYILKIVWLIVAAVSVLMIDLHPSRQRSKKCISDQTMDKMATSVAMLAGTTTKIFSQLMNTDIYCAATSSNIPIGRRFVKTIRKRYWFPYFHGAHLRLLGLISISWVGEN